MSIQTAVMTNDVVRNPGVYRCEKCKKTQADFEANEIAIPCGRCGIVTWIFLRPLQNFPW